MAKQFTQHYVNSMWYGGNWLAYLLTPLSGVFAIISSLRKRQQTSQQILFNKPVIVVGNITVGGTGKTPMVIALASELHLQGYRVGVASRGYKRQSSDTLLVTQSHTVEDVGDEPLLIYQRTKVPVMVGSNRLSVIASLIEDHQCDLVICDDGLQDYRFKHEVEIVMVDGERVFGNKHLLPAGPLRENVKRIQHADFIVATGQLIPKISNDCMQLLIDSAVSLLDDEICPLNQWQGKRVHAVAAIANPHRFFNALKQHGLDVIEHEYADHAMLNKENITFNDDDPVFMTEKDAVKCKQFNLSNTWYVPVNAELPKDFITRLLACLK